MKKSILLLLVAVCAVFWPMIAFATQSGAGDTPNLGGETCGTAGTVVMLPYTDVDQTGLFDDCPGAPFRDKFYSYTAAQTGLHTASLCGSPPGVTLRGWLDGCCLPFPFVMPDGLCGETTLPVLHILLSAGQTAYFEVGNVSPSAPPLPYIFSLEGPPPALPQIAIDQHVIQFVPTHVGQFSTHTVQVSNIGGTPLNVAVEPTGATWTVVPALLILLPGESQPVTIAFGPEFDHDFSGTILFRSNSAIQPIDSIRVSGDGCPPALPPPAPRLLDAGSSSAVYWAMPWDENAPSTEYAVEVSTDNFATWTYLKTGPGRSETPVFLTAPMWPLLSTSTMTGFAPSQTVMVRLRARDCTGLEVSGEAATITTHAAFDPGSLPFEGRILALGADSIELRWRKVDELSVEHEVVEYSVRRHVVFGDAGTVVAAVTDTSVRLPVVGLIGFFSVTAVLKDELRQARPFISWPPENARVAGVNTVVIGDYFHAGPLDSFYIDVNGQTVGSYLDCPWSESGLRALPVDFGQFDPGPVLLTVTVLDRGVPRVASSGLLLERLPYVEFTPEYIYDGLSRRVHADTANFEAGSTPGILALHWEFSAVDERTGPAVDFDWPENVDSLVLIHCTPVPVLKTLTEDPQWYRYAEEPAGVKPLETESTVRFRYFHCCCDNFDIRTTGTANGNYGGVTNYPLGPVVECDLDSRDYWIGYSFEIEATVKWVLGESIAFCSWGQDCKRTSITDIGSCDGSNNFVPSTPARSDTSHKRYGSGNYPRTGGTWGNDDYRPDNHGETLDESELIKGKIRWIDIPGIRGTRPAGKALRDRRNAIFSARVDPQCEPVNIICCNQWEVEWDVTICPGCDITQTIAPHVFNQVTPADCPALAPN